MFFQTEKTHEVPPERQIYGTGPHKRGCRGSKVGKKQRFTYHGTLCVSDSRSNDAIQVSAMQHSYLEVVCVFTPLHLHETGRGNSRKAGSSTGKDRPGVQTDHTMVVPLDQ